MLKKLMESLQRSGTQNLAKTFSRLGRIGFWVQIVVGSFPFLLMGYTFIFTRSPSGPRAGLALVEYLTLASLLILIFTIIWFHRHTRLAKKIADPQACPPVSSVIRAVWTGLIASSIGLLFSMLVMMIETGHLLFYFLAAPQGGVPVFQTPGAGPASWVSAVDMVSLMALSLFVFAELVALILSLWLLFRTMQVSAEFPPAPAQ
ncbi:MAG TPA: DUF3611 family protein [Candidatus Competibacter phosphatis]|nr:DUF3611 family protein [Candidatus Competibacter phosphatis]HMR03704.1 DUF3611 family protein [Candidatus Competibacter phosphatis]